MITGALPAGTVTPLTRLVIANAIYFKGDWASRFSRSSTLKQPFWISATTSADAQMMRQEREFLYAEADGVQLVELPYLGRDLSMIVLLPKERSGMAKLERDLDVSHLTTWLQKLERCKVDLELPRFKVTSNFSLRDTLQGLGMTDAFDDTRADFTGMTRRQPLFVQAVEQSLVVEVNEEGTKAASATRIWGTQATEPQRRVFHADHPFVFFIRANRTSTMLFLGRVLDPSR